MRLGIIKRFLMVNLVTILCLGFWSIQAQTTKIVKTNSTAQTVSKTNQETIEKIIRDYLLKNPSIIREALQALQLQEEKEKLARAANNLKAMEKELFANADTPTAGNSKGDISIVAFFDYNCGYCKKSLPALQELTAKDPSIRVIYKELPILSRQSQLAARAALAAHRQGKYLEFHNAFLESGEINDDLIKTVSDRLGLNYTALQKDMDDPKIIESISKNHLLARTLEINGTPAYIVGEQIIPGAIDANSLASIVAAERAKLGKVAAVEQKSASPK